MKLVYLLIFSLFFHTKVHGHGPEFNDLSPLIALPLGIISVVIGVAVNLVNKGSSKALNVIKLVTSSLIILLFLILDLITSISLFNSTTIEIGGPILILFAGILFLLIGGISLMLNIKNHY